MKIINYDRDNSHLWNKDLGRGIVLIVGQRFCDVSSWVTIYTLDGKLATDSSFTGDCQSLVPGIYVVTVSKFHHDLASGVSIRHYTHRRDLLLGALEI